jgi:hypothetical protein
MAIKKTFTLENNFGQPSVLPECYCKITRVVGNKSQIHVNLEIQNSEQNRVYRTDTYGFVPSVDEGAKNFIAQAYDHIKSLPEFAGAADC